MNIDFEGDITLKSPLSHPIQLEGQTDIHIVCHLKTKVLLNSSF